MYRRRMLSLTLVGVIGFCAASTARADEVFKFRLVMQPRNYFVCIGAV